MTRLPDTVKAFPRKVSLPIMLGVTLVLVWLWGHNAADELMYRRSEVQAGQLWRLFTAHWVHLSTTHLVLNLLSLGVVWLLFRDALAGVTGYLIVGLIAPALSLCLLVFHPGIEWYVGFSGVLHGLLIAGALLSWRGSPMLSALTLLVVAAKLTIELLQGASPELEAFIHSPVLVSAHVYGALLGGLFVISQWALGAKWVSNTPRRWD